MCMCRAYVANECSKLRGTDEPLYFTDRVGSYDMWAIKYGYMQVEGEQLLEEHKVCYSQIESH